MSEELHNSYQKSSYKSIFKATSLFGGVRILEILVSIIRSKLLAILIGPTGVGISGLLTSGTELIQSITSLGLSQSAVRDVADANGTHDSQRINHTVTVLRKLMWMTGLLGMFAVILASPLLSRISFGDSSYTLAFIVISITLLLGQILAGQRVVLQGLRQLKNLASSSLLGNIVGVCVCIPIYYIWGIKGIVPNIVVGSIVSLFATRLFARKIKIEKENLSIRQVFSDGKRMLKMGIAMSVSSLSPALTSYIVKSFIQQHGGLDEVGLFAAGNAIVVTYVGLLFSSMGTDFYPRLAAVNTDNKACTTLMNQQGEVGLLILGPMILICQIFIPIIVWALYSDKFLGATPYILWAISGMLLKMASWSISFVLVAKAESKLFMFTELSASVVSLAGQLIGYYYGGLAGMGIGFCATYLYYLILVYFISHKKYDFVFSKGFIKIFIVLSAFVICSTVLVHILNGYMSYIVGSFLIVACIWFSLKEMNKRLNMTEIINKIRMR